jgi:integrase
MGRRKTLLGFDYLDRTWAKGKWYHFVRIGHGQRIAIKAPLGSQAFAAEYAEALAKLRGELGAMSGDPRSVAVIVAKYLASDSYAKLRPSTRVKHHSVLHRFAAENANRRFAALTEADALAMLDQIATPVMRLRWLQAMRRMIDWATAQKPPLLQVNPFSRIRNPELPEQKPHRRWMPEHVAQYRAAWPTGTVERRALEFLIATIARGCSDVRRFARANIQNGHVVWSARKNGEPVEAPITAALAAEIAAVPDTDLLFFRAQTGTPMSERTFAEMFAAACKAAGLDDDLRAHGLRHSGASEAAEDGASVPEIAALLGDRDWKQAQRYARQAETKRLRANAHARRAKMRTAAGSNSQTDSQTDEGSLDNIRVFGRALG